MRILITGGSGMIGRALIPALRNAGHEVVNISRNPRKEAGEISWGDDFPEVDAAIHLAGTSVMAKRWTPKFIEELHLSRVGTAEKLKTKLTPRCKIVITASGANGYPFGDFTSAPCDETVAFGSHVTGKLCAAWENVWRDFPARVVALRIGFVISPEDSGIQAMLPIYKMCLGGPIASGRQRLSWIALDDLLQAFLNALGDDRYRGPVNIVAPEPITFQKFNDAFAHAVHRPAIFPIPGFALRLLYGEMADEFILADYPADPKKLRELRFHWQTPTIDEALAKAIRPMRRSR